MDHGFGAGGKGLVITGQASVQHEPTEASFYYPASFDDVKAADFRVSIDHFDVDSEVGAVLDDGVLEVGVDPASGDGGYVFLAWSRSCIPTAFSERLAGATITANEH